MVCFEAMELFEIICNLSVCFPPLLGTQHTLFTQVSPGFLPPFPSFRPQLLLTQPYYASCVCSVTVAFTAAQCFSYYMWSSTMNTRSSLFESFWFVIGMTLLTAFVEQQPERQHSVFNFKEMVSMSSGLNLSEAFTTNPTIVKKRQISIVCRWKAIDNHHQGWLLSVRRNYRINNQCSLQT